jgi:hypothetical protein
VLQALVPVMLGLAFLFWLLPPAVLLATAGAGAPGTAAAVATVFSGGFWMLLSYGMRIPVWYGLLYPIGALMALYIVLRSTWRGRRKIEWRGRVYSEDGRGVASP